MRLLSLLACTGGSDDTAPVEGCFTEPAAIEIGGGERTFEPVSDGADLTMVHGPQGGWHVLASVRLTGVDPIVSIDYTVTTGGGQVVADYTYRVQIVEDVECGGYYPGMYGYLNVSALAEGELDTPPELLAGQELLLAMVTTDLEGRVATDTLSGTAELDPVDAPD